MSGSAGGKSAAVWEKLKQNAGVLIAVVFVVILAIAIPKAFSRSDGAADVSAKTSAAVPAAAETQSGEDLAAADQASGENEDGSAADSLEGQEDSGETGSAGEALASLTSAFSNDGLAAAETEEQTYSTDASGNLVVPEREAGSFETEPEWTNTLVSTGDEMLDEANRLAAGYDYDSAISLLQSAEDYADNADYQSAVAEYESEKAQCAPYPAMNTITHIFFHSLVVDTSRAFDETIAISKQDGTNKVNAYNEVMTTADEFCRIISDMYEKGYVLVGLHDIAGMTQNVDGTETMQFREILLPPGKTPFVLSVDDVSYYEYMTGHGFASRLVLDENGEVTNEYINPDGSVMYGSYDVLTILEDFIEAHPDFSYRGARGTLALTGYEGILGYRTSDFWYNWNCDYFDEKFASQRESMYYNNENIEQDKATAKQVADAIRELGWTFASHSWGHRDMGAISYEEMVWDADMWEKEVQPLVGETDLMIFPNGADIDSWRGYAEDNQKFQYLKQLGFDYFCNVDSSQYWIQIGERSDYFRMGRRNVDGTRMWEAIESFVSPGSATNRLSDLFDVRTVFDWSRPTPVE
ncbi:MAG: polysaccharide deacetylase family protein [Lachnospiraceae bacterium]